MSYFINKKNQKIAYKRIKGKSPGIVFIHGLNSDMEGKKAIFVEKYAKKINYHLFVLIVGGMVNLQVILKILQFLSGKKIFLT